MGDVSTLTAILDELFGDSDALLDAVVADGWPRSMVAAGFAMHRETWCPPLIAETLERENVGGVVPSSLAHLWPNLPGAGVTPLLFGYLLGVPSQHIKSSRSGVHFARLFTDVWRRFDDSVDLDDDWTRAARVVVSGSDDTVTAVIERVGEQRVVGYGDRQSFSVIVDDGAPERHLEGLATDAVLWFGRGCFSARAVFYVGTESRALDFAAELAAAISRREAQWVGEPSDGLSAARMQGMAVAEFETKVWPARLGWVELRQRWAGRPRAANAVVVCPCDDPAEVLDLAVEHRQAVAWGGPGAEGAAALMVTRVCSPGELQAPPADWPHDGVENAAALLGRQSGRIKPGGTPP